MGAECVSASARRWRARGVTAHDQQDWSTCVRLVRRRGVPWYDAGDVASRVFLTLHRREAIQEAGSAPLSKGQRFALCCGIARLLVLHYRSEQHRADEKRLRVVLDSAFAGSPQKSPEELLTDRIACEVALSELKRRHPVRHAILVGYHVEGRSMPEVAAGLGLCPNTAWTNLTAAQAMLRGIAARHGLAATKRGKCG